MRKVSGGGISCQRATAPPARHATTPSTASNPHLCFRMVNPSSRQGKATAGPNLTPVPRPPAVEMRLSRETLQNTIHFIDLRVADLLAKVSGRLQRAARFVNLARRQQRP